MKCKFWKKCKLYDENSVTCNQSGGMYYADGTEPAGCYRKLDVENRKN